MKVYQRCKCCEDSASAYREYGQGCFRCAVDFVIARFGGNPNCECRKEGEAFCVECEVRANRLNEDGDSPLWAFRKAQPPYFYLAREYAGLAGCYTIQRDDGIFSIHKDKRLGVVRLLEAAETDPLAHDALLHIAAEAIRFGRTVPSEMRDWAYFAITGRISRPPQRGKYRAALFDRNRAIVHLVADVQEWIGLSPTSADEVHGQSACHAVAEGLRLLRLQPDSYPAIKRIWTARTTMHDVPDYVRPSPPGNGPNR